MRHELSLSSCGWLAFALPVFEVGVALGSDYAGRVGPYDYATLATFINNMI